MTPTPRFPATKIAAVLSDVDGTLVTDNKTLTARAQAAVAELRVQRIIFMIISSRPPRGLRMLLEPLEITTSTGSSMGGDSDARPRLFGAPPVGLEPTTLHSYAHS